MAIVFPKSLRDMLVMGFSPAGRAMNATQIGHVMKFAGIVALNDGEKRMARVERDSARAGRFMDPFPFTSNFKASKSV